MEEELRPVFRVRGRYRWQAAVSDGKTYRLVAPIDFPFGEVKRVRSALRTYWSNHGLYGRIKTEGPNVIYVQVVLVDRKIPGE